MSNGWICDGGRRFDALGVGDDRRRALPDVRSGPTHASESNDDGVRASCLGDAIRAEAIQMAAHQLTIETKPGRSVRIRYSTPRVWGCTWRRTSNGKGGSTSPAQSAGNPDDHASGCHSGRRRTTSNTLDHALQLRSPRARGDPRAHLPRGRRRADPAGSPRRDRAAEAGAGRDRSETGEIGLTAAGIGRRDQLDRSGRSTGRAAPIDSGGRTSAATFRSSRPRLQHR